MRCPSCESSSIDSDAKVHSHQAAGPARSFREGATAIGVLKVVWLMISKLTFSEWGCRECSSTFRVYEVKSMKILFSYAVIAGFIGLFTGPIPGTSFFLFCLEILMIISLGKANGQKIHVTEVGCVMLLVYSVAQSLKVLAVELLAFIPFIGYGAQAVIGFSFVFLLGLAVDAYYTLRADRALSARS